MLIYGRTPYIYTEKYNNSIKMINDTHMYILYKLNIYFKHKPVLTLHVSVIYSIFTR